MKDKKSIGVPNASSTAANALNLSGLRAMLIRKNSPEDLIRRRLREYLLFSKLRSLIPSQPLQLKRPGFELEEATEVKVEPLEIPGEDSDEENHVAPPPSSGGSPRECITQPEEEQDRNSNGEDVDYEIKVEVDEESQQFVPSIKIRRMEGSLHISTIVLKDVALTSGLFQVLEEEKLDIVFENQYRTENKVAHTIMVKVQPDYDVEGLEKKLCMWAGKPT